MQPGRGGAKVEAAAAATRAGARRLLLLAVASPSAYVLEDLTSAELEPGEKDRISHRGRALRALAPQVAADLSGD